MKTMKNLDITKVICISLKSHNDSQLQAVAATYNISFEDLMKLKTDGVYKIWIPIGGGVVIAGLDTTNVDDVYFSPEYLPMTSKVRKQILAIQPVKTPKMPKGVQVVSKVNKVKTEKEVSKSQVVLEVDVILDKISAFGMSSLLKEELDFLNGYGK